MIFRVKPGLSRPGNRALLGVSPFAVIALLLANMASAGRLYIETGSLASVFSPEQAKTLASTLPVDHLVSWKIYVPEKPKNNGVLVYVSPTPSGEPDSGWPEVFEDKNLIWVAAERFGNTEPSAQRVLVALMGLTKVQQSFQVDYSRIYIAGLSGGGRVASIAATSFPRIFTGAIYIVGADFWKEKDKPLVDLISRNRYVFITGDRDFNRQEIRKVFKKYIKAGAGQALLMDLDGYGHHNPDTGQLSTALEFLDASGPPVEQRPGAGRQWNWRQAWSGK